MRVSGIDRYLGGADNVKAFSYLQGEQRKITGTLEDTNGDPLNITDYSITGMVEFYTANVIVSSSAKITDLVKLDSPAAKAITITKTDAVNGQFQVVIPSDLYDTEVPSDAVDGVPLGVVYLQYADGSDTPEIRSSRMVIIIRRSVHSDL